MQWFLSIHPPSPLVITCYLARILIHSTTQLPNEYDKHFVDYVGGESTVKWGRGKPTTDVEGEVGDVVGLVREKDGGVSVLQRAMNRRAAQVQLRPRARPVQHRRRDVLRRRGSRLLRFVLHARSTSPSRSSTWCWIGSLLLLAAIWNGWSGATTNYPPTNLPRRARHCRLPP
jgi:hypothetical protein